MLKICVPAKRPLVHDSVPGWSLMRFAPAGMALPSNLLACGSFADKDCEVTCPVPGQAVALEPHAELAPEKVSVGPLQSLYGQTAMWRAADHMRFCIFQLGSMQRSCELLSPP